MSAPAARSSVNTRLVWGSIFCLYLALTALGISKHELWGDELHSWNIAKASGSFPDLLRNTRYEGHPPLWYTVMWLLSRLTHTLAYLQLTHFLISSCVVYLILFRSPFPAAAKALLPFGYYLLFEYGMLSRNYAVGVLPTLGLCLVLGRGTKPGLAAYYLLLLLLANSHLLGLLLAGSIHLYFMVAFPARPSGWQGIAGHALAGLIIGAASLYTIVPPRDSSLGLGFWLGMWDTRHHLGMIAAAPLKAMIPLPAWWEYHFWNTHFLTGPGNGLRIRNLLSLASSAGILGLVWYLFRRNRGSLLLFGTNLLLTAMVTLLASLTSMRYVGFIYIAFLVSAWLMWSRGPVSPARRNVLLFFVLAQLPGGLFALSMDLRHPFARGEALPGLLGHLPRQARLVTDYWCLNTVVAYTDKPAYCFDLDKETTFIQWDTGLYKTMSSPNRYTRGFERVFRDEPAGDVYLITINPLELMAQKDTLLTKRFRVEPAGKLDGAIEQGSNFYLYRVRPNASQHINGF